MPFNTQCKINFRYFFLSTYLLSFINVLPLAEATTVPVIVKPTTPEIIVRKYCAT